MALAEPTYIHTEVHGLRGAMKPFGSSNKNVPLKVTRTTIDGNGIDGDVDFNFAFSRELFSEPPPRVGKNGNISKDAPPSLTSSGSSSGEASTGSDPAFVGGGLDSFDFDASTPILSGGSSMCADGVPLLGMEVVDEPVKLNKMLAASLASVGLPHDDMDSVGLRAAAAIVAASDVAQSSPAGDTDIMPPVQASVAPPADWAATVTVMMRNIPNKYTQKMLLTEINNNGFMGTFDFLYLPIDPDTAANRGYAFLNFIDPSIAWMFKATYEGQKMNRFNSHKVVSITRATLQGFDANYGHYSTARVNRGDPSARPIFFRAPTVLPQMTTGSNRARGMGRKRIGASSKLEALAAQQAAHNAMMQQGDWFWGATMGNYLGMDYGAAMDGISGMNGGIDFGGLIPNEDVARPVPKDEVAPQLSAPMMTAPSTPKFCPYCGSPKEPEFLFCPSCGGSLDFSLDFEGSSAT